MTKKNNLFYKYLPNKGTYAIMDSSLKIIKEVKSMQEASSCLEKLKEETKVVFGFGEHIPNFMKKRA